MGLFSRMGERRRQRRAERRQDREDRIALRQQGRTERALGRQDVRRGAYAAGMDPNAFVGQGFNALGDVAQAYVKSRAPMGVGLQAGTDMQGNKLLDQNNKTEGSSTTMLIVLAALAYFLMKKK